MSERDDYLLDPSQPPDPDLAALERALAPLRWREQALPEQRQPGQPQREQAPGGRRAAPRWRWLALAAALLLAGLALWWTRGDPVLEPGASERTFVSTDGNRTIALGDIAEITLRPGSELTFVHWKKDQALFALARGGLSAHVSPAAAKEFFVVGTPRGRVIDQGCRFDLDLLPDGTVQVRVTEGMVSFVSADRSVYVPAGASTVVDANGPLTPMFDDATALLRKAVRVYDEVRVKGGDFDVRAESLKHLLAAARTASDTLPVWHVLFDPDPTMRETAEKHLRELVEPPFQGKFQGKGDTIDPATWLAHLRLLDDWRRNRK